MLHQMVKQGKGVSCRTSFANLYEPIRGISQVATYQVTCAVRRLTVQKRCNSLRKGSKKTASNIK
jgi:hypothetical protein